MPDLMMIRRSRNLTFKAASLIIAALVLFSFLAPFLPIADSVAHFRAHLIAALIIFLVFFTLTRRWKWASNIALITGIGIASLAPALPGLDTATAVSRQTIKLVQLNLNFRNENHDAVLEIIRRESPEIITFQEIAARNRAILTKLQHEYPTRIICRFSDTDSVAVLAKLPADTGINRGCSEEGGFAWLRATLDGQPLSIISVHLEWPYPFPQPQQVRELVPQMAEVPKPVLVAGDFNAAPWSHSITQIEEATQTRVAGGLRFTQQTHISRFLPPIPLPIDHILLPSALTGSIKLGPPAGSDHRPLIATLSFWGLRGF